MNLSRRGAVLTAAAVLAILALGAGAGAGLYAAIAPGAETTTVVDQTASAGQAFQTAAGSALSVNAIYERSYQGVVDITVTTNGGANASPSGFGSTQSTAEGSGFVFDSRGDVVTNDHVVAGASSIRVRLWNGESYPASLVGADPSTDLAVVRVGAPAALLHPLPLGDSSSLAVGDPVVAIGSPFGLPETLTAGIVSALHRSIDSPNNFTIGDAIQTDAAINHGNSGGPLIDASARVIGINSQIQSDSGGNEGVGFAIPSDTVSSVVSQLIADKTVAHAYLGVEVQNSSSPVGAELAQVLPGTPAAKAGLEKGDIITALGGSPITNEADVAAVISTHKPGETVSVSYLRAGKTNTVKLILGTRPS